MASSSPTQRDYLFGSLAVGLAVLAIVQLAGGAWWLIAEGDTGVIPFTPIVVVAEGFLAWAAWRRTTWTKNPVVPGRWRDRNRALSPREVALTRGSVVGLPVIAVLGSAVDWWDWTFPLTMVVVVVFQMWLMPEHHRRQLLSR